MLIKPHRKGSGKSHTTSVLLESCLIKDSRIGTLPAPLSGLVYVISSLSVHKD